MNGLEAVQVARLRAEIDRLKGEALAGVRRAAGEIERGGRRNSFAISASRATGRWPRRSSERERGRRRAGARGAHGPRRRQRRLAAGEYGLCEDCGNAIGFARLEAQPPLRDASRCQEKVEKRGGQSRPSG